MPTLTISLVRGLVNSTGIGASYGTSKSGVGIAAMGVLRPDLMMKCIVPVVMAGIIAVSGRWRGHLTARATWAMRAQGQGRMS